MAGMDETSRLFERAKKGDPEAFGQLAETHYRSIYGIAFSTLGNWSAAQDITQETFLLAWLHKSGLRNAVAFPAWLRRIAVNLSKNWIRSADYRRRLASHYRALPDTEISAGQSAGDAVDHTLRRDQVWQALESLSPANREVVVLYYMHGESLRVVAESLGISENAAKKRLQHGRAKLREHFEEQWKQEMVRARHAMGTRSARDRFLAGMVIGPALPELGRSAASTGLGLWWEVVRQTAVTQKTLTGVGIVTAKKAIAVAAAAVLIAGGAYWAITHRAPSQENSPVTAETVQAKPVESASASTPVHRMTAPPPAAALPIEPGEDSKLVITPVEIKNPKDYVTLRGLVVDSRDVPVAGAEVSIAALGLPKPPAAANPDVLLAHQTAYKKYLGNRGHYWNGATDESGEFVISGIRFKGATLITARAPGYMAAMKYLALDDPDKTSQETITLRLTPGTTLYGLLLGPTGQPVKDGSLKLEGFVSDAGGFGGSVGLAAFTDETGHFELDVEGPGSLSVSVASEVCGAMSFSSVPVNPDEELVLRYPPATSVFGVVSDRNGKSVPGVEVRLEGVLVTTIRDAAKGYAPSSSSRGSAYSTETNSNGSYRIERIDSGQRYTTEVFGQDGIQLAQGPGIEEIKPGADYELNFTVMPQMTVRGTVYGGNTGKPIEGIVIVALPANSLDSVAERSGPTKSARTSSGSDGTYALTITGDGRAFSLLTTYNEGGYAWNPELIASLPTVTLEPGETVTQDLRVDEPATRSFIVVDDTGSPVEGTVITIQTQTGFGTVGLGSSDTTDAQGRVTLESLAPLSEVTITFAKTGYINAQSAAVSTDPGDILPEETVILYRPAEVSAMLIDADGKPVANQTVQLIGSYGAYGKVRAIAHTDEHGVTEVVSELPATDVTLQFFVEANPSTATTALTGTEAAYSLSPESPNNLGQVQLEATGN